MVWVLCALVLLLVFAILEVSDSYHFIGQHTTLFADGTMWHIASILLIGCVFLCHKFRHYAHVSHTATTKWIMISIQLVVLAVIVILFALRTLSVVSDFQVNTPMVRHKIMADVVITQLSDSIYDASMPFSYRQVAHLENIVLAPTAHQNTAKINNPFDNSSDWVEHVELPARMTVLLTAPNKPNFEQLSHLIPNTKTRMTLIISPLDRQVGSNGFDSYRWLRTRHVHAQARVVGMGEIELLSDVGIVGRLQALRYHFRSHFYQKSLQAYGDNSQALAVTLSLLTGDRALIDKDTKRLYQFAGILHLLAISGTHVVFLAMMLASLGSWVGNRFPRVYCQVSRSTIRLVIMLGASVVYAIFTGFDVPAVRTLYMLFALAIVHRLALPISSLATLVWVALIMIWLDPVVVWQAGFWLSFVAVFLLMRYGHEKEALTHATIKESVIHLAKLQVWLFLTMLPISVVLFGKVSLWGMAVNVVAVGLFSAVIVPINLLAGVSFFILPAIADGLWWVCSTILAILHRILIGLQGVGEWWIYHTLTAVGMVLCVLAIVPFVVPLIKKRLAIVPMMAVVLLLGKNATPSELMTVSVLSDDDTLSQILVRYFDESTAEQVTWLMISDFGSRMSPDVFADMLIDTLKKHGVKHVTGVIVQTPQTPLVAGLSRVHDVIPIHRYWQAGQAQNTTDIPMITCEVGRKWQTQGLEVYAITGWQQIADKTVWGCTAMIESQMMPVITGINTPNTATSKDLPYRLVINGATHQHTWQMYEMMCQSQEIGSHVWLTHSKHVYELPNSLTTNQVVIINKANTHQE